MNIPGQLSPSPRLLLGPGPSDAHPRVLSAMTTPLLGHLDPQFLEIMNETQAMLREVYQTTNPLTFPVSATGTAGMETCLVNLIEPGDKAVIFTAGYFGNRMVDIAGRCGAQVTVKEGPWGQSFDLQQIRETLQSVRPKVLGIVHAETSTGVLQDISALGKLCHEFGTLLITDCVTSLGCVPVKLDAWEVDAAFSCSQKGLSCPPGMSPVSFSPRAVDALKARKSKVQSWYLDLTSIMSYWGGDRSYHHTAPITMVYALREGLRLVLEEGLEALGLQYTAAAHCQLPQLNAVRIPDGLDDVACRKRLLAEFGIEIGGGLGDFKGKAWRIGLMGHNSRPNCVFQCLAALEQVLLGAGAKVTPGAGVAAAEKAYAA
jgi:alanine-glyoxylate transaminase/serine-glyoxylate transaminase/serine-pyruvate transaminase